MGMARVREPETSRGRVKLHMVREQKSVLCVSHRPGVCKTRLKDSKATICWPVEGYPAEPAPDCQIARLAYTNLAPIWPQSGPPQPGNLVWSPLLGLVGGVGGGKFSGDM